MANVVWEPWR